MPNDSQLEISGTYYKAGSHGLVFIWLNDAWTRSGKSADELYRAIKRQEAE
jgi:hypothetical protein